MPSYDFVCRSCGHSFNQRLSISERKNAVCEKCGSSQLEQQFRCCNVLGSKSEAAAGSSASRASCSRVGGCGSCSGC